MADGYVLSRELKQLVQDCVRQYMNSFQPRPKSARRPRPAGGSGDAAIAGSLAVASDGIGSPADITWADVPQDVKDQVDGTIPNDAPCWKLESGAGTLYQLVAKPGQNGFPEIADIYMVPVPDSEETLYNMAGAVGEDNALQVKRFTAFLGGAETTINLIDVEKCP